MSRTYRCKNAESEYRKCSGSKIAGVYTQYDYGVCPVCGGRYFVCEHHVDNYEWKTYRYPTDEELFDTWYMFHGESKHANRRGPGKWYKRERMKENRSITKRELAKWWKDPEYEPMIEEEPRSHLWDWW